MAGPWRTGGPEVLALVVAVLALGGCEDDPSAPKVIPGDGVAKLEALGPGIHPVLSAPGWTSMTRGSPVRTSVHLVGVELEGKIASYQGEFRYDSEQVRIQGVRVPEGLMAVWNETEPGVIRFAGVALEGLGEAAILLFDMESNRPIRATDFKVTLEEVVAAQGFVNLTDKVVNQDGPVLTSDRVLGG